MFKKMFLPVGVIAGVVISFILPEIGIAFKKLALNDVLIIAIFLICGWQTKLDNVRFDRNFLLLLICGAVLTLGIAPWCAVGIARLFQLGTLATAGLIVIAAMPPTLSSGVVITETAGGSTFLAMTVTIIYSIAGVFILPAILPWCLASDAGIKVNSLKMLWDLVILIIIPSAIGYFARKKVKKLPSITGYIPSVCVILLVWSFFSSSNEMLRSYPVKILLLAAAGSFLLHIFLMAGMWYLGKACRAPEADCKAMVFTGASKTLTISLATLTILKIADGAALAPCLVFYFVQMIFDSAVAAKMGMKGEKEK